jgi:hypothetical protein
MGKQVELEPGQASGQQGATLADAATVPSEEDSDFAAEVGLAPAPPPTIGRVIEGQILSEPLITPFPSLYWVIPTLQVVNQCAVSIIWWIGLSAGFLILILATLGPGNQSSWSPLLSLAIGISGVAIILLSWPASTTTRTFWKLGSTIRPEPVPAGSVGLAAAAIWLAGLSLLIVQCLWADWFKEWVFLVAAFLTFLLGQFSALAVLGASPIRMPSLRPEGHIPPRHSSAVPHLAWAGKLLGLLGPTWIAVEEVSGFILLLRALVIRGKLADRVSEFAFQASSDPPSGLDPFLLILGAARLVVALLLPFVLCLVVCLCRLAWEMDLRRGGSPKNEQESAFPASP